MQCLQTLASVLDEGLRSCPRAAAIWLIVLVCAVAEDDGLGGLNLEKKKKKKKKPALADPVSSSMRAPYKDFLPESC